MNFRRPRTRSRRSSMNFMSSTEKWRNFSKRITRMNNDFEEDSEEDEPKISELQDWVSEFFERKSECLDMIDQDVEVKLTKKQTLLLSTLVPDEILQMEKFDTENPTRFVGVLLMADVSGYTALSEKYNNIGKGGTYRLTVTLNTYLGSLIEVIYSHGGDIIKFAGDAFLALWKTDKRTFLNHTIHAAITCALIIQHSFGSYETDVKVNLKVKLAISAGNLVFAPIGSGVDMNYVIIGLPVFEAKIAESVCMSGEVKLTPTAWAHCYTRNYDHVVHEDGHVTIKAILYDPRENDVTKPFPGLGSLIRQIKHNFVSVETLPDLCFETQKDVNGPDIMKINELLNLRRSILIAEQRNLGSEIRKFMIRPILTQIDAHQPLEYLTEMRQVSVLFLTLKPRECPLPQLITIVNNAYQITCEIVYKSMGCVNKIILFDKDIMILVIFGLRGFKHESEAQATLKCAYSIKKSVAALDGVKEVSIGVTTGQVYCGVVGHPLRREFTVIGAVVNKAARFMCSFRNKITCDEATFIKSKMSSNGFTLQAPTELKGIVQPGKIYEYTEEIRVKELYDISMIPPLLNRSDEMEYFESWLVDSKSSFRDFDALLLAGESRIGKTRLLEWMARCARNSNFHVSHISLTSIHSATPYLALSQLINQILDLKEPISGFEKEEKIVEQLHFFTEDLCYLNNVLKVRFAYYEGTYAQNEITRKEKAKDVFKRLIASLSETHVIFLDDLQNLDSFSWEFISIMINSMKIFTVLAVTRGKFSFIHDWLYHIFVNNNIRKIVMTPLTSTWVAPLACQILDVDAVPIDLCNTLRTKCNGMPGLIESFIVHLFSSGALEIKKINANELNEWRDEDLQFPNAELLHPVTLDANYQSILNKKIEEEIKEEIGICFITRKEELNTNINTQNLDALIMIQIDSLTPYQQLLLKIASVIGNVLSRDLLESIMYENNPLTTAKAIKRLFALRILACANVSFKRTGRINLTDSITSNLSVNVNLNCHCSFEHDPELNHNLPKYAFCKVMKFKNKNSRKTCYELLPLNQKKEFHSRIVHYLENNRQKCLSCGGTLTIVQSNVSHESDILLHSENSTHDDSSNTFNESDEECEMGATDMSKCSSFIRNESHDLRKTKSDSLYKDISSSSNTSKEILTNSKSLTKIVSQHIPILKKKENEAPRLNTVSIKKVTMPIHIYNISSSAEESNYKIFDMLRKVTEAKKLQDWHDLGIIDSEDFIHNDNEKRNIYFNIKIENGVSQINVKRCTCAELNVAIFEQLIHHAKEADLKIKMIEFLIQFCYLNILANNFESILPRLDEAESLCIGKETSYIKRLDRIHFLGKIYTLKAASYLMCGKTAIAKLNIERAIRIYGINLNNISGLLKIGDFFSAIKLKRQISRKFDSTMKSDSIFCLNVITFLYSTIEDERTSRRATLRALYLAQRVRCNLVHLCDVFTNAFLMHIERGSTEKTFEVEKIARSIFKTLARPVRGDELFAIGKLFLAMFRARIARAHLSNSIRAGYRALVISRFLFANKISLDIIPDLYYVLLSRCRIKEAVGVVKSVIVSNRMPTLECETWYYALCIDLILDAGFQVETIQEINRFAEHALDRGKNGGPARRRLVVSLWAYWLRTDMERKAKRFEAEALNWTANKEDDGSLNTLLSAMRLAEGMLESLAKKMDDLRKIVDVMELRSLADKELSRLEKDALVWRAVYPRWLLLKAYSLSLSGRHTVAVATYNQALEEARRINNRLEEAQVRATSSNSKFWIQSARVGHFMSWNTATEQAKASWHQLMYKINAIKQGRI